MSKQSVFSVNSILLAAFCLCGFSGLSVNDVETAIIRQDYEQARRVAEDLLSGAPSEDQRLELSYYMGICSLRLGEFARAKKIFGDLSKTKKNVQLRDKAYLGLFDAYYSEGNYNKAYKTITRLLKLNRQSEFLSLIYLKLARVHLRLAQWYKACGYLTKIISEYPDSLEVHAAKQLLNEEQYFAVQVGAFLDKNRAERLVFELQEKGEYAYIIETVDQENKKFYRVRVGQLVQLEKAQKLEVKLSQEGYPTRLYP